MNLFNKLFNVMLTTMMIQSIYGLFHPCQAKEFHSSWNSMPDRIWIGSDCWANPWERWSIIDGKLACMEPSPGLNIQNLLCQVSDQAGTLETSIILRFTPEIVPVKGSAGFKLAIQIDDPLDGYQSRLISNKGIFAGLKTDGTAYIDDKESAINPEILKAVQSGLPIQLKCEFINQTNTQMTTLKLTVTYGTHQSEVVSKPIPAANLAGNIGLFCEFPRQSVNRDGLLFFDQWQISGSRLSKSPDHVFGPILWSNYTVNRNIMKMTAQMPPIGPDDSQTVGLQIKKGTTWDEIDRQFIDCDSYTALFRITDWNDSRDQVYRLHWQQIDRVGRKTDYYYAGVIRKNPVDKNPLIIAGLVCFTDYMFPYPGIFNNLRKQNPDLLVFLGDQFYEDSGGFGIMREGDMDLMFTNYLRKVSLLMWACRDQTATCPSIVMPDDHDVYQGNVWGQNGRRISLTEWNSRSGYGNSQTVGNLGGYVQPARWLNAIQRSQTAHLPDPYDSTPVEQGISVYYTDLFYGGISFAILEDRKFKAGPMTIDFKHNGPRPDHIDNPVDAQGCNDPKAWLYGPRQLEFIQDWINHREPEAMKIVVSQTIPCNAATHHGGYNGYLFADMDSNGWPQDGRNRFLAALKGKAFVFAGDQHITTIIQQGIKNWEDSVYSFCIPAGCTGYPRWWRPEETPHQREGDRIDNRPNTGRYHDGFGNLMTVLAVGNPPKPEKTQSLEELGIQKTSGWGILRCDKNKRTITMEAWRYGSDPTQSKADEQFEGWPMTISLP